MGQPDPLALCRKSDENWTTGHELLAQERMCPATNRLYYSVFQAVYAYATAVGAEMDQEKKHLAMIKFVAKSGKNGGPLSQVLVGLRGLRETADYETETPKKTDIEALLPGAATIREHHIKKTRDRT